MEVFFPIVMEIILFSTNKVSSDLLSFCPWLQTHATQQCLRVCVVIKMLMPARYCSPKCFALDNSPGQRGEVGREGG